NTNPTNTEISITKASHPFYLNMREGYNSNWKLELNNNTNHGVFRSWIPFVSPDEISAKYHYRYDGYLNGWYVDPVDICGTNGNLKEGCKINEDGTYNIEMTVEFFPQRWFYLGLLISGTTLAGCLGYLGYDFVKRRKRRVERRKL
ncbi:MAG TPA: hypothetical protein VN420_01115, partial [Candidatus Fimivivens sp.]|nr:hypothetical protein [Candidatus Fimivivens sp.]